MVLGTSSGAGKSWLTTALCRWYARQGLKVAPFKAQNMSNNARVVASENGVGEIGSAQFFQALAARAQPHVHMNPVLLKPEADTRSQVGRQRCGGDRRCRLTGGNQFDGQRHCEFACGPTCQCALLVGERH